MRDTIVGLTALGGVAGLIVILLTFGELSAFTDRSYTIRFVLNTAVGLDRGSAVTLNGVRVGEVNQLTPLTFPDSGVEAELRIQEGVRIPVRASVSVLIDLLGDGTLSLTAPIAGEEPTYIAPGQTVRKTATTLLDEVAAILDQRLSSFNEAAESLVALSEKYVAIGDSIGDMLQARTPSEVDAGLTTPNIRSTITRLDTTIAELETWLSDEQLRGDARDVVSRLPDVLDRTSEAVAAWTRTAESIENRSEQVGAGFDEVVAELKRTSSTINATLGDVRQITARVVDGEGTVGQLVNNPDLYRSLTDAARRLESALTEAQLLIQKIEAEGVPVNF